MFECGAASAAPHSPVCKSVPVVPEAPLEPTENGLAPQGDGWFVLNARDARWFDRGERGLLCYFESDEHEFPQFGFNLFVLGPGNPMSMYHWEADQEDFLVLHGEALLIAEGEERPLRQWDFVHCPVGMSHVIIGAGEAPCIVVAVGAREHQEGPDWGGYPVDDAARRHNAGVDEETNDPETAYARFTRRQPTRYRDGWLP
jgi:uncharacterized cupin superfamily protein